MDEEGRDSHPVGEPQSDQRARHAYEKRQVTSSASLITIIAPRVEHFTTSRTNMSAAKTHLTAVVRIAKVRHVATLWTLNGPISTFILLRVRNIARAAEDPSPVCVSVAVRLLATLGTRPVALTKTMSIVRKEFVRDIDRFTHRYPPRVRR